MHVGSCLSSLEAKLWASFHQSHECVCTQTHIHPCQICFLSLTLNHTKDRLDFLLC